MLKFSIKYLLMFVLYNNTINFNYVSNQSWLPSLNQFSKLFEKFGSSIWTLGKVENKNQTKQSTDWSRSRQINYWINNQVPYVFHSSCNQKCRSAIREAITEWERYTCIRFIDWGDDEQFDEDQHQRFYIRFRADQSGCFTVFRKNSRHLGQSVNLGEGCLTKIKVLHELGHVLHLDHTHGRPDRDFFIDLKSDNIHRGFEDQYELRSDLWESVPYDYRSIMHYQSSDFSLSPFKLITMSTRKPNLQYLIDQPRVGLSFYDIKQVNLMYNCSSTCSLNHQSLCHNQGIILPNLSNYHHFGGLINETFNNDLDDLVNEIDDDDDGGNCLCLCPPDYTGPRCEISKYNITKDYQFDQMVKRSGANACGEILKSEGLIQTMDYPKRIKPFDSCSWIINAPKGYRIELTFNDFWFDEPTTYLDYYTNRCVYERVEIRCKDPYEPEMYCGRQLNNTVIISKSNYLIINVIAGSSMIGRGFSGRYKFIP
ncbi:blastula protease 10-like [Panonychus citri]|uniref:blastula protease 10-like n=1 Tax=Panonychus citri TaxID=50023 RepID=UPI0023082E81|nr:blastula protease 10-like [Panonychus citri]